MEEKKPTSEAQKRATQKYLSQFIDMKVRVTPKGHAVITAHAKSQGESTAAFIRRAIFETMERDNAVPEEEIDLPLDEHYEYVDSENDYPYDEPDSVPSLGSFFRKRFNR